MGEHYVLVQQVQVHGLRQVRRATVRRVQVPVTAHGHGRCDVPQLCQHAHLVQVTRVQDEVHASEDAPHSHGQTVQAVGNVCVGQQANAQTLH